MQKICYIPFPSLDVTEIILKRRKSFIIQTPPDPTQINMQHFYNVTKIIIIFVFKSYRRAVQPILSLIERYLDLKH